MCIYSKILESPVKKVVITFERLCYESLYYPGKDNVVADALSQIFMGSVTRVEDGKKELVCEVQ